ncbi:hypothetical protein PVNG_04905 [Plasmodium vivax North Korean]|uniref:Uncharacterized protein n=1 Tax=Plasmodium vivax North Korean TaxID=1035514 RepID=A0A0J9U3C4_PLAVI|nr:hypothetical protein PVNG_04905 [Plasmodium vivax North Korean]
MTILKILNLFGVISIQGINTTYIINILLILKAYMMSMQNIALSFWITLRIIVTNIMNKTARTMIQMFF